LLIKPGLEIPKTSQAQYLFFGGVQLGCWMECNAHDDQRALNICI